MRTSDGSLLLPVRISTQRVLLELDSPRLGDTALPVLRGGLGGGRLQCPASEAEDRPQGVQPPARPAGVSTGEAQIQVLSLHLPLHGHVVIDSTRPVVACGRVCVVTPGLGPCCGVQEGELREEAGRRIHRPGH